MEIIRLRADTPVYVHETEKERERRKFPFCFVLNEEKKIE
jgi:hypothetical protein